MLIQKLKKDDIVVFRTVGSDEVIGKLIEESDTSYKVSKPLALAMTQQGVGMTAYVIMADPEATFEFLKSTIITAVLANKQAKDAYTQSTSKLVTPSTPSLVT